MPNTVLTQNQWTQIYIGGSSTVDQQVQVTDGKALISLGVPSDATTAIDSSAFNSRVIQVPAGVSVYARPNGTPYAAITWGNYGAGTSAAGYELLTSGLPSALMARGVYPSANSNRVTALGDSRVAAIYIDPAQRRYNMRSALNWARQLGGQRITIGDTFGVSGDRTDQVMARLASAVATGAGILYIQCGVNDIAQNYPTASTSGATAAKNIIAMAEVARQAGMRVIIENEIGAENLSAAQMAQVMIIRQRIVDYQARASGVWVSDTMTIVMNPYSGTGQTTFKPGYSLDGTHLISNGALYAAAPLISIFEAITAPRPSILLATNALVPAVGRMQLLDNPTFAAPTGGNLGTGMTGTVPSGWTVDRLGGVGAATAVVGTQPDPDGLDNNVTLACTFTAAGDRVVLRRDVALANWSVGDILQAVASVQVVGQPVGLAQVSVQIQVNGTTGGTASTTPVEDGYQDSGAGSLAPVTPFSVPLATRPFTVPTFDSKGYVAVYVFVTASAAGSANVVVKQVALNRRLN